MINFASLFNQFRINNSISDLIDAPGITLDKLLDEESFLNEFKSGNSKVQQFMKYDKYQTLTKYITEVGPADDRKRSYKYPLTSCELLSSDNSQTIDFFFGDNPIIIREEVVDNSEPVKEANETQVPPTEDKPKTTEKIVIKDKLEGEESNTQTIANETKNQNNQSQNSLEIISSENIQQQDKSEHEATSQQANPKIKIIEKEVEPLRYALFSYFEGEVNYTLAGYVSKVFSTFFTKKPQAVMKFLLEPERFKALLNHIESRSVGQLVVKLLTFESTELIQQRKASFEHMLEKVSKNDQIYIISNLSGSICQLIEKVATSVKSANESSIELSHIYFTPATITQIISNVMSDEENVSVYNGPILQTYLTFVPLVIPQKSQMVQDLKQLLLSFLRKTLQKLKVQRQSRPSLGFGRMKIVQIMSFVLKQNILNARELTSAETQFFSIIFNLCKNYQYNNVLHNEVVKIVQIALNEPQDSKFLELLLQDDVFLNFLITEAQEDQKIKSGTGSQKSRKGYIGHIVSMCRKVQQAATNNSTVAKLAQRKQFENIIEDLVNKQVYEYNKNLAGYSMKRGIKHPVLFMKQDVIQEHIKFLTSTPPPVFETEPQHINIEHPDLIQAQRMQIEAALHENEEAQKVKDEEEHFNPRFFPSHLQYNLDDLMVDL